MEQEIFQEQIDNAAKLFEQHFPNEEGDFKDLFKNLQELYLSYKTGKLKFSSTVHLLEDHLETIKSDFDEHYQNLISITETTKSEIKKKLIEENLLTIHELNGDKNV